MPQFESEQPRVNYPGWGKTTAAAEYAGVSVRTLRKWLRHGLKHSRLPSGTIWIKFSNIDAFLDQYEVESHEDSKYLNELVNDIMDEL